MANVLVIHNNMGHKGGGEQVCLNVLESLSEKHEVELLTTDSFDLEEMNSHFNTNVEGIKIELLNYPGGPVTIQGLKIFNNDFFKASKGKGGLLALWMIRKILLITHFVVSFFGHKSRLPNLLSKKSLYHRIIKDEIKRKRPDVVINTGGDEVHISDSIIQYIHYPQTWEWLEERYKMVRRINEYVSLHDRRKLKNDTIVTNSEWTRRKVESIYPCSTKVVHPPILYKEFEEGISPENRADGFVIAGRIAPKKNIIRSIRIIKEVRESGFDVILKIIGPDSQNEKYSNRVKKIVRKCEWATYEGKVSRQRLTHLFTSYKYGIHGHSSEHFGIVIAEMVAAGMLPFVPNDGGQVEIVRNQNLLYESENDAVEKINNLLSDEEKYKSTLENMPDIESLCDPEKFKKSIREIVDRELEHTDD